MTDEVFVLMLGAFFALLLGWGFKTLPGERWQILATVPLAKDRNGRWKGLNFTYYGLLSATAYVAAIAVLFLLTGAVGIPVVVTVAMAGVVLAVCVPASRFVAVLVEKKLYTFTVAGAFFVGVLIVPAVIWLTNLSLGQALATRVPLGPVLAAMAIAYAVGEGLGRLACISFGCCYGKSLSEAHPLLQRCFARWHFTFLGSTKKIAYASNLEGAKVIPVQAITAILYVGTALLGVLLFLKSYYLAALLAAMGVTQVWRVASETLRADFRGNGTISAYQWMALLSVVYIGLIVWWLDDATAVRAQLGAGLQSLWDPLMLVALQVVWLTIFVYTGRSMVTESTVSFHVCRDRI